MAGIVEVDDTVSTPAVSSSDGTFAAEDLSRRNFTFGNKTLGQDPRFALAGKALIAAAFLLAVFMWKRL